MRLSAVNRTKQGICGSGEIVCSGLTDGGGDSFVFRAARRREHSHEWQQASGNAVDQHRGPPSRRKSSASQLFHLKEGMHQFLRETPSLSCAITA